jgi:hypothetical protein
MTLANEPLEEFVLNFYGECTYSHVKGAHEMLFEIDEIDNQKYGDDVNLWRYIQQI